MNLKYFCTFYREEMIPNEYGGTSVELVEVLSTRCFKEIKSKSSQSKIEGQSFDFYQVFVFTIRGRKGFEPTKDMIIDREFVIRGVAPVKDNPKYLEIYTEKRTYG